MSTTTKAKPQQNGTHPNGTSHNAARTEPVVKQMTGASMVWEAMVNEGVHVVFGHPGGAILPTYDALRFQSPGEDSLLADSVESWEPKGLYI